MLLVGRQGDLEPGAGGGVGDGHRPAVRLGDGTDDGQSEPETVVVMDSGFAMKPSLKCKTMVR